MGVARRVRTHRDRELSTIHELAGHPRTDSDDPDHGAKGADHDFPTISITKGYRCEIYAQRAPRFTANRPSAPPTPLPCPVVQQSALLAPFVHRRSSRSHSTPAAPSRSWRSARRGPGAVCEWWQMPGPAAGYRVGRGQGLHLRRAVPSPSGRASHHADLTFVKYGSASPLPRDPRDKQRGALGARLAISMHPAPMWGDEPRDHAAVGAFYVAALPTGTRAAWRSRGSRCSGCRRRAGRSQRVPGWRCRRPRSPASCPRPHGAPRPGWDRAA